MAKKKAKKKTSKKVKSNDIENSATSGAADDRVTRLRLGVKTFNDFPLGDMESRFRKRLDKLAADTEAAAAALQKAVDVKVRKDSASKKQAARYAQKAKDLGYNEFDKD